MKKKTLVLIGIAVCAMLLASPVLASAGYSKIYGNANEDDVLDMRDVTYIKLVIFGKKPVTAFADANYDGKISMLDIGQTKLIILGKEKQLTLVDKEGRTVTIPRPIERVFSARPDTTRVIIALGGCDKLVGMDTSSKTALCSKSTKTVPLCVGVCGGKFYKLPVAGKPQNLNFEVVLSLKPDVVFRKYADRADVLQEQTGIPVVCPYSLRGSTYEQLIEIIKFTGTVLEKEKEAEELITFHREKVDKIKEVTSKIPEEERPKVYLSSRGYDSSSYGGFTRTINRYDPIEIAGGINVAKDVLPKGPIAVDVSKEQIIKWNPDIIIISQRNVVEGQLNNVELGLSDPDLQMVNAVVNKRVYFTIPPYSMGNPHDSNLATAFYLAKCFHPDKFKDLDVEKEGNEIYKRFWGVNGLFSEYADYLGWLREWLDSQK